MFWRFGGYANISSLDTILDKPDVTVEELLEESDLIQELKQQNSKLIEFLRDEPVLKKLLKYVVTDDVVETGKDGGSPSAKEGEVKSPGISFFGKGKSRSRSKSVTKKGEDGETEQEKKEAQRKKYAYVAAEVLSSEVWSITEALLEHRSDLREFWQYMHTPAPLDPLQAGYFTKVNEALLDKKTEDMLAFFRSLDGIVPAMLQHVDCPMVMDLLLKIISLEKHEGGAGIVDWLQTQDIIPLLLGYLTPEHNNATQTSAGDFLKAIITISANATTQDQSVIGPNELTRQLVSEQCIQTLTGEMLRGGNALTVGVGIIIEVIRKNNSDYDVDSQVGPEPKTSDPIYLGTLLRQFAHHVPDFMHLIRSPSSKKPDLKAAFGRTIEPLGFDRFKTCELMAELLHCSNMGLLNERGAEEDVRKRDAERERLKAEGKLATPRALISPVNDSSHDEFASSVDSHGFHHAERPTDDEMGEKTGEGRRLEIQNASDEDGFEKVNPRDAEELPDEVNFDEVNEKAEESGLPALEKVDKRDPSDPANQSPLTVDVPKPLSPSKPRSPLKTTMHFDPPPTHAADSPTSAEVTDKVGTFSMDEDTVMTEFGEEPVDSDDEGPTELEKELAKDVDRPAPLFARKEAPAADDAVDPILGSSTAHDGAQEEQNVDQSIATIQGEDAPAVSNGERMQYDTEADGSPVVGDLLKMRFVDYHVVPTILDFFFRFPWNNFLHNVVYDVVQQVFNGTLDRGYNRTVALDLFKQIVGTEAVPMEGLGLNSTKPITNRILDGQAASDRSQADKGMRLGYMGHLTLIAEEVCKFGNRRPAESLDQSVHDGVSQPEWIRYVDGILSETHDKDNAVLGGVRPENAIGLRNAGGLGGGGGGIGSGFTNNTTSALASAGIGSGVMTEDSLAMSEGTVGQSFEINSGTMLSGFGEGGDDDDDEMAEEEQRQQESGRPTGGMARSHSAFSDDEQPDETLSPEADKPGPSASSPSATSPSIPPPLNIPPSRARLQLAARLAQKKRDLVEQEEDPDAADGEAVRVAEGLAEEPRSVDLGSGVDRGGLVEGGEVAGLQITGLRSLGQRGSASRFSGLFGSEDSSSEDEDEEDDGERDEAGREVAVGTPEGACEGTEDVGVGTSGGGVGRRRSQKERRPSTTEAKERKPLDDEDDDEDEDEDGAVDLGVQGAGAQHQLHLGGGPFADPVEMSSEDDDEDDDSEDELVEIRPTRRTS